jgi:hypothetical protein
VCGPKITGASGSRGAAGLVIHRLSPWTLLITALEAVEGWFLGLVSPSMTVGRCGRPSSVPCDEPPLLRDAGDRLGMTVVAVEWLDKWTH